MAQCSSVLQGVGCSNSFCRVDVISSLNNAIDLLSKAIDQHEAIKEHQELVKLAGDVSDDPDYSRGLSLLVLGAYRSIANLHIEELEGYIGHAQEILEGLKLEIEAFKNTVECIGSVGYSD
jgi:hypothetical protein